MKTVTLILIAVTSLSSSRFLRAQVPGPPPPLEHPLGADVSFFYDALSPYGQWLWVEPHGWVWIPGNMEPGWRPYTQGQWAYTDAGWTWSSNLPWGWAPFHYGRWFFEPVRGWCWVPGSEWAPAWVTWHWGDDFYGWAPIPPGVVWQTCSDWDAVVPAFGWCFVRPADFCRPRLHDHIALVAQNVTLLRATRNITRFEARGRLVVNASFSAEQVERATGRAVRRLSIAEANAPGPGHVSLRGATRLNVYRPVVHEIPLARRIEPPQALHRDEHLDFEQLRREEQARHDLEAQQARERAALERAHQNELRRPPAGLTAPQLQERHEAEHRAFHEQVTRQNQVFENRRTLPAPPPQARGGHPPGRR